MDINNRLEAKHGFKVHFDSNTETLVVSVGGVEVSRLKLNRANPKVPTNRNKRRRRAPTTWARHMPLTRKNTGFELNLRKSSRVIIKAPTAS